VHAWRVLLFLACLTPLAYGSSLSPDALENVMERAQTEGKFLYIAFLGEGWSVSSKRFTETVLETPAFRAFAEEALIYFPVEARRKPPLTKEETAVLQSWVIHFDIKAYPTFILIAPDGQELLRHGYREMDAQAYLDLLRSVLPAKAAG